jgi:DNA mismatch endonuclease, patch repair protein
MVDILQPSARSALMRRIGRKDTSPEMKVRQALHAFGYRFRLHVRALPGSPDLVFASRRKVLFVNGCFWHAHDCVHGRRRPSTNVAFWQQKAAVNRERDARKEDELRRAGWDVLSIWECELKEGSAWLDRVRAFLGPRVSQSKRRSA